MAFILDAAFDSLLNRVCDNVENLYLNSAEATTFTEASSTNLLGTKATPSIAAAANATPNGRQRTVAAITDGSVSATGTATHIALTDDSASELALTNSLTSSQSVTSGNTFTTDAMIIRVADATAV